MNASETRKARGRPPTFDRAYALDLAIDEFRRRGYEGASMDQLADAMGITKPSIYRAFGDRKALFRAAVARYGARISIYWRGVLAECGDLPAFAEGFLAAAVEWYLDPEVGIRGCLVLSTMGMTAVDPDLRDDLADFIRDMEIDVASFAQERWFGGGDVSPSALDFATLLTADVHSLAVRARAGASPEQLRAHATLMANSIAAPAGEAG